MARKTKKIKSNTFTASVVRVAFVMDVPVHDAHDYKRIVKQIENYDVENIVAENAVDKINYKLVEKQVALPKLEDAE